MGAKDLARALRQPGELVVDPTNLSTAFPYGGTRLGYTEDGMRLRPQFKVEPISGEPGEDAYQYLYLGGSMRISGTLLQWDDDTVQRAFPGGLTTAGTYERVIQYPGTLAPGAKMSDVAVKFLWVPNDRTHGKLVLARKAFAMIEEGADIPWSRQKTTGFRVTIFPLPDTAIASSDGRYNSRILSVGFLEELTL